MNAACSPEEPPINDIRLNFTYFEPPSVSDSDGSREGDSDHFADVMSESPPNYSFVQNASDSKS